MLAVDEGDERKAEQIGQALIQKGRLAVLPADIHLIFDERGPSLIIRFADDAAERFLVMKLPQRPSACAIRILGKIASMTRSPSTFMRRKYHRPKATPAIRPP